MAKRTHNPRLAPTSEVGSTHDPQNIQSMWHEFFQQQNNNFAEIIRLVREPSERKDRVVLPKFKPDVPDADALAWCSTVDLIMCDKVLQGSELILALSGALLGEASRWFTQICFSGITWQHFKELFKKRFTVSETNAAVFMNLMESRPKSGECVSAYASRVTTSLEAKVKDMSAEEIAVSFTLANIARQDNRLKRLICTTNIGNRNQMQHELNAYSYSVVKSNCVTDSIEPEQKRVKTNLNLKCHYCGKIGHKLAECREREKELKNKGRITTKAPLYTKGKTVVCYKCGTEGHIATACPKRGEVAQTKRVDVCYLTEPKGTLQQTGELFPYYFDSGSECSIIKESIAAKISGQRFHKFVSFKGIGNATVISTLQILANVVISNFNLEVLFHVVVDECIKYDIRIGRENLSLGFSVIVTQTEFELFKCKSVNSCITNNPVCDKN